MIVQHKVNWQRWRSLTLFLTLLIYLYLYYRYFKGIRDRFDPAACHLWQMGVRLVLHVFSGY